MSSGNGIVIASTVAMNLALTWGGVQYSWSSYHVMVPLMIGIAGLGLFLIYETRFPQEPIVPWRIWGNRTTGTRSVFVPRESSRSYNVLGYRVQFRWRLLGRDGDYHGNILSSDVLPGLKRLLARSLWRPYLLHRSLHRYVSSTTILRGVCPSTSSISVILINLIAFTT